MLVLSRKKDEKIILRTGNEEVVITVVRIDANKVRIGIKAGEEVIILREELIEKPTE